jgi:ubiquinone/menaquinone biosynthesis C-methylase UbiE
MTVRSMIHPALALSFVQLSIFCLMPKLIWAQDSSVMPGINSNFASPDVAEWSERFEREGREPFDRRDVIVEATKIKPGMDVADIGAGTGLFTRLFAKKVGPKGRVYAVDIAQEFIDHIAKTCQEAGLQNVVGVVCTAEDSRLAPDSIDVAFICDTYHHFEFPYKTMRSIHRALRPHGTVVVIDFRRIEGESREWILEHVRANQETFRKEIESVGFELLEDKGDLLKDNYFMRFRKAESDARAGE